jgi:hypothetical protein
MAAPALHRQGEKERATIENQWRGEILPKAVKKWRPALRKLGGGSRWWIRGGSVVELDRKVTDTGDKPFSLSFSHCAPPQVMGEKKVREEAGMATGRRGERWGRHVVRWWERGLGAAHGQRGRWSKGWCVCEKDREKAYGGCTRATAGGRIFFITMSLWEVSGVLYSILIYILNPTVIKKGEVDSFVELRGASDGWKNYG